MLKNKTNSTNELDYLFLVDNIRFFLKLFSAHYSFSEDDLIRYKELITLGSSMLLSDSKNVKTEAGLIFNPNIKWEESSKYIFGLEDYNLPFDFSTNIDASMSEYLNKDLSSLNDIDIVNTVVGYKKLNYIDALVMNESFYTLICNVFKRFKKEFSVIDEFEQHLQDIKSNESLFDDDFYDDGYDDDDFDDEFEEEFPISDEPF